MLWAGETGAEDNAKVLNVKGCPIGQRVCVVRALMVEGVHLVAVPKHHHLVLQVLALAWRCRRAGRNGNLGRLGRIGLGDEQDAAPGQALGGVGFAVPGLD